MSQPEQLTRMEYAMKSLSLLSPKSLSSWVAVNSSVVSQQLLAETTSVTKARPYRVSNADRSIRKGIMADSLLDLSHKVQEALSVVDTFSLVLEEDGTIIETEEYFQTLNEGTVLMVLEKGQKWRPAPNQASGYQLSLSQKPSKRMDVASVTFDFYKARPDDFIGCLNVKATLYGNYTLSYDLQCYGAKRIIKEALRCALFSMQATGHVLVGTSCFMQHLLEDEEKQQSPEGGFLPLPTKLIAPSLMKMLQ
ncbi:cell death activator CIDE-3 isoform X2 [Dromiciops gliroides]|uniref:cell death activator CIDE-3 isoform X2 n=1 Tax=Dromiciops gliroides TaxID=33562 RepID=UPI001CC7A1CC|nr:cell death activator CIDE-3 isoform X2 [Dromiciops gliroides]